MVHEDHRREYYRWTLDSRALRSDRRSPSRFQTLIVNSYAQICEKFRKNRRPQTPLAVGYDTFAQTEVIRRLGEVRSLEHFANSECEPGL